MKFCIFAFVNSLIRTTTMHILISVFEDVSYMKVGYCVCLIHRYIPGIHNRVRSSNAYHVPGTMLGTRDRIKDFKVLCVCVLNSWSAIADKKGMCNGIHSHR